jgi:hypothetical protein
VKRKTVILSALLLIAGNNLTHLWGWLPEKLMNEQIDIFLKPEFHLNIVAAWYLKEITDDLNTVLIFFVMGMLVKPFSHSMYAVATIFCVYYVIDAFMLVWDFKQTREIYWVSSMASMIAITFLFNDDHKMKLVK